MSLVDKLRKASTLKQSAVLSDSQFFNNADVTATDLPILNLALSGSLSGGFKSGMIQIAGPSRHYKSNLGLYCVSAYLKKHKDAVCLFYDSEFGAPPAYVNSFGIDLDRVIHSPITDMEELKFDLMAQMNNIERGEKVIVFVDSIGNLASRKETDDAVSQKVVADFTKAKSTKSLWRMVTPKLTTKDITCIVINHTYDSMEMYGRPILSGGVGNMYAANTVIMVGRSQEKDGTELSGYKFTLNIEKSRAVRERSKFPLYVNFDTGINKWSGLLDLAVELGIVTKPKLGWYTRPLVEGDKNWRAKDTNSDDFWQPLFEDPAFEDACNKRFQLGKGINTETPDEDEVEDMFLAEDDLDD